MWGPFGNCSFHPTNFCGRVDSSDRTRTTLPSPTYNLMCVSSKAACLVNKEDLPWYQKSVFLSFFLSRICVYLCSSARRPNRLPWVHCLKVLQRCKSQCILSWTQVSLHLKTLFLFLYSLKPMVIKLYKECLPVLPNPSLFSFSSMLPLSLPSWTRSISQHFKSWNSSTILWAYPTLK